MPGMKRTNTRGGPQVERPAPSIELPDALGPIAEYIAEACAKSEAGTRSADPSTEDQETDR